MMLVEIKLQVFMIFKHKVTKEYYFQIPCAAYLYSHSCDTSVNCFFLLTTYMTNTQNRSCVEKKNPLSLDLGCILSENSVSLLSKQEVVNWN